MPPLALTEKVVAVPTVTGLGVAVKEEIVGGFPPLPDEGHPPVAPPTSKVTILLTAPSIGLFESVPVTWAQYTPA